MRGKNRDHIQSVGFVKHILNENFGIIEIGSQEFALFDTYDLYLTDEKTAADAGRSVDACLKVNQKVVTNACYVNKDLPLTHLATAVWSSDNVDIKKPQAALTKDEIAPNKLQIFEQVSKSCGKLIDTSKLKTSDKKKMIDNVYDSAKYK